MVNQWRRKNERLLAWLRAIALAVVTWAGLNAMHVRPTGLGLALAGVVGLLALMSAELGVLASVTVLCIPLIAAQPVLGLAGLVFGIVAVRYLGADGGRAFLVVGISVLGAFVGPIWAGVALAGFLHGSGEGALAAAVACVVVEGMGIGLGRQTIGAIITGGPPAAIVSFEHMPATMLSAVWLREAFSTLSPDTVNRVVGGFAGISQPLMLVVQPVIWAAGAGAAGMVRAEAKRRRSLPLNVAAVATGTAVPAIGSLVVFTIAEIAIPWTAFSIALLSSLAVAIAVALVWERMFPLEAVAQPASAQRVTMSSEDADVDELLRLIATAEDKLASQHTTQKVVIITDMKSFSTMTERMAALRRQKRFSVTATF